MDDRPPSRQIEEAILTRPVVEDLEERSGPHRYDFNSWRTNLLVRQLNRSVSELTLYGNAVGIRPRANSLQDDRRLKSPSGTPAVEGSVALRSLPTPCILSSFGGFGSGKTLNVEALSFIPPPISRTPPIEPSERTTTVVSPPAPDPRPIGELVEEPRPPSPHPEGKDITSTSSTTSAASTVKPVVPVTTVAKPGPPSKQEFTRAERRAVETVINVLLEMKSNGEARAGPGNLPQLVLAKNKGVYRNVGQRANRFWKLIGLGVQMGWLETGPGNSWIDVGMGWTEDTGSES